MLSLCHCGYSSDQHNFRHLFQHTYTIATHNVDYISEVPTECRKDAVLLELNTNDWPEKKKDDTKCTYPQCTAGKLLHGSIIKSHEFVSDPTKPSYRDISVFLPNNVRCLTCTITPEKHLGMDHNFVILLNVLNKKDDDVVNFSLSNGSKCKVISDWIKVNSEDEYREMVATRGDKQIKLFSGIVYNSRSESDRAEVKETNPEESVSM